MVEKRPANLSGETVNGPAARCPLFVVTNQLDWRQWLPKLSYSKL